MCFGDWFAQTAQLGQKQRPSAMSGSPHSTPVPQPTSSNLESLHQQWMESFSEALSSCMENMAGLSAEETQRVSAWWSAIIVLECGCGAPCSVAPVHLETLPCNKCMYVCTYERITSRHACMCCLYTVLVW